MHVELKITKVGSPSETYNSRFTLSFNGEAVEN
jgi:hypothetical protein